MNARKFIAILLAVLMVIPAMIMPSSATKTVVTDAEADTESIVYSFTTVTDSELEYLDTSIGEGTVSEKNIDKPEWHGRYVDGSKFYGYAFPIKTTGFTKLTFSAMMRGDIYVQVSFDKVTWETAATMEMLGETDKQHDEANRKWRNIDLTAAYNKLAPVATDMLYLRFGDCTPDGYGTNILASHEASLTLTYPVGTRENIQTISFNTAKSHTGEEANYYHAAISRTAAQGGTDNNCHYSDRDIPFIYAYEMLSTEVPEALALTFKTANQLKLDVSTDAYHWVNVYMCPSDLYTVGSSGGLARAIMTFDLLAAYKTALANYPSNMLYVRIGDADPTGGWGGAIYHDTPFELTIVWPERAPTGDVVTLDFTVQGDDETDYWGYTVPAGINTATGVRRFVDRANKLVYKYPLTNVDTSSEVTLTGYFSSQFLLELSLDNTNWVRAFKYMDIGLLATQNANDETTEKPTSQNGFFFPEKQRTIDLTAAIAEAAKVATSKEALYIRLGDSHPVRVKADGTEMTTTETNYNKESGWGGKIYSDMTLNVRSSDEMQWVTSQVNVINQYTLNGTNYYMKANEPMLVTDGQTADKIGSASVPTVANHASLMKDNGDGTYTLAGNGSWLGRSADSSRYFVYKYELPKNTNELNWTAWVGGGYGIDIAFGSADYANVYDKLVWSHWANCNPTDPGYNYKNGATSKMTLTYELSEEQMKAQCVYLKIYDYDTANSGFGGRVMFGTNYPITMTYYVSVANEMKPTLKSASLALTQNFNVIFKLDEPQTSNGDATVSLGWADGTLSTATKQSDGTYIFEDILPGQMGREVKLIYSGTCLDNSSYTSKVCTYSVKDYCQRMIKANASNTKFVTLLSDILTYGAAAQTYSGVAEQDLVTTGVTDLKPTTEFTAPSKLTTVLSRAATEADAYQWRSATLVLDTTTAIRYTFTAASVDGLQVAVSRDGEAQPAITSFTASEDGTYYYFDIPVYANRYDAEYTVYFGEANDYSVTYSVNHYIATKYDESQIKTSALLRAIYNYGASVDAYLAQ